MQAGGITNNLKVNIYITLSEISTKKTMTWNCYVVDSANGRYVITLCRDLLSDLGLNLKFSGQIIEGYDGPFKGSKATMVDLGAYKFKYLNTGKITSRELFINSYAEEIHQSEQVHTSTERLRVILNSR